MADEEVWVQLYIGKDKSGQVFDIDHGSKITISALKKAVYQASAKSLEHCDPRSLEIYEAGTEFPTEEAPLRPGLNVPTGSTDEKPLRVVAPVNQSGKN